MSAIIPGGISAVLPGTYQIATLPPAAQNQAKYAFVTDLGGGADMVISDGANWKHIRLGAPDTISAVSGTVTITPLASAPIQMVTGSILTSLLLSISSTNLYQGYMCYIRRPGVLIGSLGIQLAAGGATLPILGSATSVFVYDAGQLVQVQ